MVLLASLTYGIIEAPDRGWGSPAIVGAFAIAVSAVLEAQVLGGAAATSH